MRAFFSGVFCAAYLFSGMILAADADQSPATTAAAWRWGVIDSERCFVESKEGKHEISILEQMQKKTVEELEKQKKALVAQADKLNDPIFRDSLNPKAEQDLREEFERSSQAYWESEDRAKQAVSRAQQEMQRRLNGSIRSASRLVAVDRGLKSIFFSAFCPYVDVHCDCTAEVLEMMNKEFTKSAGGDSN